MQIRTLPTIVGSFRIRIHITKLIIFGVMRDKMRIREMPTIIVGSSRIRVYCRKMHAYLCFAGQNPNTECAYF